MRNLVRHLGGLGSIRGAVEGAVVVFRGIPYAAPPIGSHRFLPPDVPIPWQGMRDATVNGPIAPQPPLRVEGTMGSIGLARPWGSAS